MTTMIDEQNNYVLTATCASSRGIIAGVSTFLDWFSLHGASGSLIRVFLPLPRDASRQ